MTPSEVTKRIEWALSQSNPVCVCCTRPIGSNEPTITMTYSRTLLTPMNTRSTLFMHVSCYEAEREASMRTSHIEDQITLGEKS